MTNKFRQLVIESVKTDGNQFRPSDWIERISANLGVFGSDRRLHYSKEVRPQFVNGEKCLVVEHSLTENPAMLDYILNFAESNGLKVHRYE